MTDQSFEQRLAAAIAAYADHAPTEMEPVTMARLAAARSRRIGPVWFGHVPAGRGLAVAVALLALLVTMLIGAFVAGGYLRERGPEGIFGERILVEPFIGLPPEGATPSMPETGVLVLSSYGRVSITEDVHGIWVYADGRLIWRRSLDPWITPEARRRGFDATDPTTAVIEQWLTHEGVELLRSELLSTGLSGMTDGDCTGPAWWGDMAIRVGEELVRGSWCDPELPGRLADHASWLPASAWEDRRIGGYVPSWYKVCVWSAEAGVEPSAIEVLLPRPTKDLFHPVAAATGSPDACDKVTTDDARTIVGTLGVDRAEASNFLSYRIPNEVPGPEGVISFIPFLPHGEAVEYGQ